MSEEEKIRSKLPRQYSPERKAEMEDMEAMAEFVSNVSAGVTGSNFLINILLASSLSLLWGIINAL